MTIDPYFSKKEVRERVIKMFRPPKRKIPLIDRLRGRLRRKPRLPEL